MIVLYEKATSMNIWQNTQWSLIYSYQWERILWTALQNSIVIFSSCHFDKEKTPGLLCTNLLIIEYWKSNILKRQYFWNRCKQNEYYQSKISLDFFKLWALFCKKSMSIIRLIKSYMLTYLLISVDFNISLRLQKKILFKFLR